MSNRFSINYNSTFINDLKSKSEITLFYVYNFQNHNEYQSVVSDRVNDGIFIFELSRYGLRTGTALGGYFPYLQNLVNSDGSFNLFYRYKTAEVDEIRSLGIVTPISSEDNILSYTRNIFTIDLSIFELNQDSDVSTDIKATILTNKGSFLYDNNNPTVNDNNTRTVTGSIYQHYHDLLKFNDSRDIDNTIPAEDVLPRFKLFYIDTISPVPGEIIGSTAYNGTGCYYYNNILYKVDDKNHEINSGNIASGTIEFQKNYSTKAAKFTETYQNAYLKINSTQEIYSFARTIYDINGNIVDKGIMGDFIISLSGYNLNPDLTTTINDSDLDQIYILVSEEIS